MTSAAASTRGAFGRRPTVAPAGSNRRSVLTFALVALAILIVWEALKFIGGVPWRAPGAGPGSPAIWNPPFRLPFANDLNLPHVWNIVLRSEEHTSELQSHVNLVCRLLLEKKKKK